MTTLTPNTGAARYGWSWLAHGVLVFAVAAALASSMIWARDAALTPERYAHSDDAAWSVGLAVATRISAVLFALVGALIAAHTTDRAPVRRVGGLCVWIGGLAAAYDALQALPLLAASQDVAVALLIASRLIFTALFPVPFVWLMLLFPTGEFASPRWRLVAEAACALWLQPIAYVLVTPTLWLSHSDTHAFNPLYIGGGRNRELEIAIEETSGAVAAVLFIAAMALALAGIIRRWRGASTLVRRQIQWLMVVLVGLMTLFGAGPFVAAGGGDAFLVFIAGLAWLMVGAPAAIGVAILRHRLVDVDLVFSRALVFGGLSVFVLGVYSLVVGGVGSLLLGLPENPVLALIATALVAATVVPMHGALRRGVNRLLYGERGNPYAVVQQLGLGLQSAQPSSDALRAVARTIGEALKFPYVAVDVAGDRTVYEAERGAADGARLRFPITHQGEALGELWVGLRPGDALTPDDRALLEQLGRQAGTAVHAARLSAEVQRSRERIVAAREEERRRLRRDLHDGLGPALAAQALKLDVALDLVDTDPAAARDALARLKRQTQAVVGDVRRIVHDLRPPALDELGLAGAVREAFAAPHHAALDIRVDAPEPLPPLPAAVEVAAYRIAAEAVTNALRHARARECRVRFDVVEADAHGGRGLAVEVRDDGVGLPPSPVMGVGLRSMRERAEELGGRLAVESPPEGGTRVRAVLPLSI